MRRLKYILQRPSVLCTLWIAVCFSLTSAVWISWEYNLMALAGPRAADIHSMVIGYLLQAAGAGAGAYLLYSRKPAERRGLFIGTVALFAAVSVPAVRGTGRGTVMAAGMLMNLLCGVIAGAYLYAAANAGERRRSLVFGCGYGISTLFVWLLSLPGGGNFLHSRGVMPAYLLLAAAAVLPVLVRRGAAPAGDAAAVRKEYGKQTWALALVTVFLLSLVKNMGFSFPSEDISAGVRVELSRISYAVGLAAAGLVNDRDRRYGAVCTAASLAVPFVLLGMTGEAVSGTAVWALGYLFFGFFSVFRVVLLLDMAAASCRWYLAPRGLLAGRVGDAAGTAACIGLKESRVVLILWTLLLFIATMILFFRLFQTLYMPEAVRERSERELFEDFSIRHDLSAREKEVLRLVLAEQSNAQIAEALFVTENTIKYHVHNLLQKTGCRTRQELIKQYNLLLYPQIAAR